MLCGLTRNTTACRSSSSSNNRRSAPAHPRLAVRFVVHHLYVSTPNSPLCSNSNSRSHSKLLINTFAVSTSSSPAQGSGGAVCDAHPADEEQGKQQLRKPQHAGSEAAAGDSSAAPTAAAAKAPRGAGRVLRALCHYEPTDLSDGPASLAKVCMCVWCCVCVPSECTASVAASCCQEASGMCECLTQRTTPTASVVLHYHSDAHPTPHPLITTPSAAASSHDRSVPTMRTRCRAHCSTHQTSDPQPSTSSRCRT